MNHCVFCRKFPGRQANRKGQRHRGKQGAVACQPPQAEQEEKDHGPFEVEVAHHFHQGQRMEGVQQRAFFGKAQPPRQLHQENEAARLKEKQEELHHYRRPEDAVGGKPAGHGKNTLRYRRVDGEVFRRVEPGEEIRSKAGQLVALLHVVGGQLRKGVDALVDQPPIPNEAVDVVG